MTYVDRKRIKLREIDRIHADQARAEELRCKNVIEAAGWEVTRVTLRFGSPHYAIVNKAGTYRFGTPEELARKVQDRQRPTTGDEAMSSKSGNSKGSDSRSPLAKRGGTKIVSGGSKEK